MSEPKEASRVTETEAARSVPPPPPPAEPRTDLDSAAEIEDEEARGWPDEPTAS